MKMEIFSCSGGLAKGFADEGIEFDLVVDKDKNAVESYAHNLGHRPVQMDAEDLLRMVYLGWQPAERLQLLVADPPCTPWSRAGARKGMADKRDQLRTTVELIRLLEPYCFLIANVPGLDDLPNLKHVHATIGSLRGYIVQYVSLDAAAYGVPQHRHRPFWFGRPAGTPELRWPSPTHGADARNLAIPGCELLPYVTCRQALAHLSLKELGKPIRMRIRRCNGKQHSSVPDRPARVVGTSNLSDGNVLAAPRVSRAKRARANHMPSDPDRPARTLTANTHGEGRLAPPGHHGKSFLSDTRGHGPNAIKLSERAGAVLQGFPETWKFLGKTKEERWSMIGQAMPPGLARPVAHSVRVWLQARLADGALTAYQRPAAPAVPPAPAADAATAPSTLPLVLEPLSADEEGELRGAASA